MLFDKAFTQLRSKPSVLVSAIDMANTMTNALRLVSGDDPRDLAVAAAFGAAVVQARESGFHFNYNPGTQASWSEALDGLRNDKEHLLRALFKSQLVPLRAIAFETMEPEQAVDRYPELAPLYRNLDSLTRVPAMTPAGVAVANAAHRKLAGLLRGGYVPPSAVERARADMALKPPHSPAKPSSTPALPPVPPQTKSKPR